MRSAARALSAAVAARTGGDTQTWSPANASRQTQPSDGWVAGVGPFVALLPGLALLMVGIRRLMAAPTVALALRTPVAAPVPVATFQRTQLAATPWWRLFLAPVYAAFLTWRYDLIADPVAPRHLVFTVLAVGLIALAVVGGVNKWRAGSAHIPA